MSWIESHSRHQRRDFQARVRAAPGRQRQRGDKIRQPGPSGQRDQWSKAAA
jgi:hypothetical protein